MIEEWRDVKGYEGLYQVSNMGRVKSITFRNNKIEKPKEKMLYMRVSKDRRVAVCLYNKGKKKMCSVHRLVAKAFIENPDNLPEVNHIDGNPSNNYVTNLEWCDDSYNKIHAYWNGLTKLKNINDRHKKPVIRSDGKKYDCAYSVAKDLNVSVCSIRDVLKGRMMSCKGYGFKYD